MTKKYWKAWCENYKEQYLQALVDHVEYVAATNAKMEELREEVAYWSNLTPAQLRLDFPFVGRKK